MDRVALWVQGSCDQQNNSVKYLETAQALYNYSFRHLESRHWLSQVGVVELSGIFASLSSCGLIILKKNFLISW